MTQSASISPKDDLSKLREQLTSRFDKTRKSSLTQLLAQSKAGWAILQEMLQEEQRGSLTWLSGSIYRGLLTQADESVIAFLDEFFPDGVVTPLSERGVDYGKLQALLIAEDFEEADRHTNQKLCELAGPLAEKRKWIYFSDVDQFPIADLKTIDLLWQVYSEGKFGFAVQRELWLGAGQVWENLWPKIGWKTGTTWTRYPGGFVWDLSAPRGHLPLSNQLRGVRVMDALMNHPAFQTKS